MSVIRTSELRALNTTALSGTLSASLVMLNLSDVGTESRADYLEKMAFEVGLNDTQTGLSESQSIEYSCLLCKRFLDLAEKKGYKV